MTDTETVLLKGGSEQENYDTFSIPLNMDKLSSKSNNSIMYHPSISTNSMYALQSYQYISVYSSFGELYRKLCFTQIGMIFVSTFNIIIVLINIIFTIYEIIYMIQTKSYLQLPSKTFIIFDIIITLILLIEILLNIILGYQCKCIEFICYSTYDNFIDTIIGIVSILDCVIIYIIMFHLIKTNDYNNIENISFLFVRIIRDFIRILRCIYFVKYLSTNIVKWTHDNKISKSGWDIFANQSKSVFIYNPNDISQSHSISDHSPL